MTNQTILEAVGRIGGVILLFGFIWAGLSIPLHHQRRDYLIKTGPLLVIVLGLSLLGFSFGFV